MVVSANFSLENPSNCPTSKSPIITIMSQGAQFKISNLLDSKKNLINSHICPIYLRCIYLPFNNWNCAKIDNFHYKSKSQFRIVFQN